jgi:hypothetical protein
MRHVGKIAKVRAEFDRYWNLDRGFDRTDDI